MCVIMGFYSLAGCVAALRGLPTSLRCQRRAAKKASRTFLFFASFMAHVCIFSCGPLHENGRFHPAQCSILGRVLCRRRRVHSGWAGRASCLSGRRNDGRASRQPSRQPSRKPSRQPSRQASRQALRPEAPGRHPDGASDVFFRFGLPAGHPDRASGGRQGSQRGGRASAWAQCRRTAGRAFTTGGGRGARGTFPGILPCPRGGRWPRASPEGAGVRLFVLEKWGT